MARRAATHWAYEIFKGLIIATKQNYDFVCRTKKRKGLFPEVAKKKILT